MPRRFPGKEATPPGKPGARREDPEDRSDVRCRASRWRRQDHSSKFTGGNETRADQGGDLGNVTLQGMNSSSCRCREPLRSPETTGAGRNAAGLIPATSRSSALTARWAESGQHRNESTGSRQDLETYDQPDGMRPVAGAWKHAAVNESRCTPRTSRSHSPRRETRSLPPRSGSWEAGPKCPQPAEAAASQTPARGPGHQATCPGL